MISTFLYLLLVVLLSRLWLVFYDRPLTWRSAYSMVLAQLVLMLPLRFGFTWALVFIIFATITLVSVPVERRVRDIYGVRVLVFIALVLVCNFTGDQHNLPWGFQSWVGSFLAWMQSHSALCVIAPSMPFQRFAIMAVGFLVVIGEMNHLVRFLFNWFGIVPSKVLTHTQATDVPVTPQEYNTGRIIGLLERGILYAFILLNQFGAIGFVLAAKGLVRFKELDNRAFAEYILVGTLLSAFVSIMVALTVRAIIR